MKSDKSDRRIRYTKMVLKEALVSLVKLKPISKITVKEICEQADINRATFYSHYADQYDLLKQIEKEITEDISQYITSFPFNDNEDESLQMMCKIFEFIKENCELCSVLLSQNGDRDFSKVIMLIVQKQYVSEWSAKRMIKNADAEYIYSFVTIGSIGLIQMWLKEDMKKSAREMAELLFKLTNQGINAFI